MLHNEARELLVEAYNKHPVAKDIAEVFSVSTSSVYRLVRQKVRTGTVELRVSQRGRKKLLSEEDIRRIQALIEAQNDITIEEIRETLGLKASYTTVERAVRGLGYRLKKKSLHASERDRARCTGKTCGVERTVKRNRPKPSGISGRMRCQYRPDATVRAQHRQGAGCRSCTVE